MWSLCKFFSFIQGLFFLIGFDPLFSAILEVSNGILYFYSTLKTAVLLLLLFHGKSTFTINATVIYSRIEVFQPHDFNHQDKMTIVPTTPAYEVWKKPSIPTTIK